MFVQKLVILINRKIFLLAALPCFFALLFSNCVSQSTNSVSGTNSVSSTDVILSIPVGRGNFSQRGRAFQEMSFDGLVARHASFAIGTKVKVTNVGNNREIEVTITGRIIFEPNRIVDLSLAAWRALELEYQK